MKRVLVTGGAGFVAHRFIAAILDRTDWEVVSLDRLDFSGTLDRLYEVMRHRPTEQRARLRVVHHDLKAEIGSWVADRIGPVDAIYHIAAGSHVDRSIQNPVEFVLDNVLGTANLLEFARKQPALEMFLYFSCYDEKTRAVTKEGFKTYDQLKPGDLVLSINPNTKEIEEVPIKRVIVQDYAGEMITFNTNKVDICVTPNHRIYWSGHSTREQTTASISVSIAEEVARSAGGLSLPTGRWIGKSCPETIYVPGIGKLPAGDLLYVLGAFIGDGLARKQLKLVPSKSGLTKKERDTKAKDSRTGRFVKTAKIGNRSTVSMTGYEVNLAIPKGDKARSNLVTALTNLGVKFHEHVRCVNFGSRAWFEFFKQCEEPLTELNGGTAARTAAPTYRKKIPEWALEFERPLLRRLFDGLIDSDGHRQGDTTVFTTVSKRLVKDICELGFKLGRRPRFAMSHGGKRIWIVDHWAEQSDSFVIHFPLEAPKVGKNNANKKHYVGKIWCVEVPGNRNLLVERNGRFTFCGNTDEVFGPAAPGVKHTEYDAYNSGNPYSATKAGGEELCVAYRNTFRLPILVTHTMNVFGERQHPEKFIPATIAKVRDGEVVTIHSDATKLISGSRHYIHLDDVADALLFLSRLHSRGLLPSPPEGRCPKFNIVGEREISNLDLARMIAAAQDTQLVYEMVDFHQSRPGHDLRYALDGSLMKSLGWEPKQPLETRVAEVVRWSLEHPEWLAGGGAKI